MNAVFPPLVFYTVGGVLIVAGAWRALTFGRRRSDREIADDDPARPRARRRHFLMGWIWVVMGLVLIASTAGVLRSKAEKVGSDAPVIHFNSGRPTTASPPATQ